MKNVHLKSALPIYICAAVWLLAGLIFPKLLMKLPGFLITAALSAGGYFLGSKLFPGRDITVEEKIETGDAKLDRDIADGKARLQNLRDRVYPDAAKPLGRTGAQAERAIRHVIEAAWRTGEIDRQQAIFGDTVDARRGRPTCGEMIAQLADILRWEG